MPSSSLHDWEMRADRNSPALNRQEALSLHDWEMRADRNIQAVRSRKNISLHDWEMRADRNVRILIVGFLRESTRLGNAR